MTRKCFLIYPCGKKFEIRIPIIINIDGKPTSILPGTDNYFKYAKNKFEINNLKIIEEEVVDKAINQPITFISLVKKLRCVE